MLYAVYEMAGAPELQRAFADAALPGLVSLLQTSAEPTAQSMAAATLGRLAVTGHQNVLCQLLLKASCVLRNVA